MVTVVKTFNYSGTLQQAVIPAGTTSIDVHLWAGGGGAGGRVEFILPTDGIGDTVSMTIGASGGGGAGGRGGGRLQQSGDGFGNG